MSDNSDPILREQKQSSNSEGLLSTLYKKILFDLKLDTEKFNALLVRYIIRARLPVNVMEESTARGNIRKELLGDRSTWKTFIKGLIFINVVKVDFIVRLHHADKRITEHKESTALDMEQLYTLREEEAEKVEKGEKEMFVRFEILTNSTTCARVQLTVESPTQADISTDLFERSSDIIAWRMTSHRPEEFEWSTNKQKKWKKFRDNDVGYLNKDFKRKVGNVD